MILTADTYEVESFSEFRARLDVPDNELVEVLDPSERAQVLEVSRKLSEADNESAPPQSLTDLSEHELHDGIWHVLDMDETRMIRRVLTERRLPYLLTEHVRGGPHHRIVEVYPDRSGISIDDDPPADETNSVNEIADAPSTRHSLAALEDLREFFRSEGMSDEQQIVNAAHTLVQEYCGTPHLETGNPPVAPSETHVVSTSRDQVWLVAASQDGENWEPEQAVAYVQDYIDPDDSGSEQAPWVYYEGTLDEPLRDLELDGVAILNP